jgi:hypothetical protein
VEAFRILLNPSGYWPFLADIVNIMKFTNGCTTKKLTLREIIFDPKRKGPGI